VSKAADETVVYPFTAFNFAVEIKVEGGSNASLRSRVFRMRWTGNEYGREDDSRRGATTASRFA